MNDPVEPKPKSELHSSNRAAPLPGTLPVTRRAEPSRGRLLVIAGQSVNSYPVPDEGELTVGRGDDADLRIDDPSVSRLHARLVFEGGTIVGIRDCGSSNGTRIRNKRLQPDTLVNVRLGETFEVGTALLMMQGARQSGGGEPAPVTTDESGIVIGDRTMASLYEMLERVSKSTINVLLLGETGVGKDVMARRLHAMSARADKPFLALNCGALPDPLLESELFGHERGAFTGAVEAKAGLLETADGGTVFLDEIGELPMAIQVKLLRVLEDRQARRVGGTQVRPFDIRFVAATNRDLEEAVQLKAFRADLYYRINGISLFIPPLRQRIGEIEELTRSFVRKFSNRTGGQARTVSADALAWLKAHPWPGNIRELQNCIERAVLLATGTEISLAHLSVGQAPATPDAGAAASGASEAVVRDADPERTRIIDALEACAGNQTRAAKLLSISRNTLLARLDAYGIPRPRKPRGG